jgi:protein required for attachment to host cells
MKPKKTWVLIADASRARVLESEGKGEGLRRVAGMEFENELPPTHELVDDRQPRSYESVGSARHAVSGRTDPRRKEKRRFVEFVSGQVEDALDLHAFDRLVLVAPPQVLGDFRDVVSTSISNLIVAEFAKDLTKTPDNEIAGHLDLPFSV